MDLFVRDLNGQELGMAIVMALLLGFMHFAVGKIRGRASLLASAAFGVLVLLVMLAVLL